MPVLFTVAFRMLAIVAFFFYCLGIATTLAVHASEITITGPSGPVIEILNLSSPSVACNAAPGTSLSVASISGDTGTFSMSGNTTDFVINPKTGIISVGPNGIVSADCGKSFANTVTGLLAGIATEFTVTVNTTLTISVTAGASPYVDLCSQVSCAYAYSIHQRLVVSNTSPGTLTRFSDGATYTLAYTGPNFTVDTVSAEKFCLANGGTVTPGPGSFTMQYNDCGVSKIANQAVPVAFGGSCDLVQTSPTSMPLFQVRLSDGEPELNENEDIGGVIVSSGLPRPGSRWLMNKVAAPIPVTGCALTTGGASRTLIISSSNQYFNTEGGRMGQVEDPTAGGPAGAMFAAIWWGPVAGAYNFATDVEADASCPAPIPETPIADAIVLSTYSGLQNTYYNGGQIATNCVPGKKIQTGYGISIGCEGDKSHCGLYVFRDMVILSEDISATPGLPAAIYSYMKGL
jgi:hypothetical protein